MHGQRSQKPHLEGPSDFGPRSRKSLFSSPSSSKKMENPGSRQKNSASTSNPSADPQADSTLPHLPNLEQPEIPAGPGGPPIITHNTNPFALMVDHLARLQQNQEDLARTVTNLANQGQNTPPRQQPIVPLKDFYDPSNYEERPGVVIPQGDFEIKPAILNLIKHFHGLPREDPFCHLEELTVLAQTTRSRQVQEDMWLMRLFPLSLKDKASHWFRTVGRPITTWPQLKSAFLKKFFPIGRTNALRRSITTFQQKIGEPLHEAWERFQELLRSCPHHEIPQWQLLQIFYHGLEDQLKRFVDASCGGNFLNKDAESAYLLFEEMSENSFNMTSMDTFGRSQNPRHGVPEIDSKSTSVLVTQDDLYMLGQRLD